MEKFNRLLGELKKLNFPENEFAVFGSGPMAIRNIKDGDDLDIVVKDKLWKKLIVSRTIKRSDMGGEKINIGEIEVYRDWMPWFSNSDDLIDKADIIDGIRFVNLKKVLEWKKSYAREKDLKHVKMIEEYLKKGGN